MYNIDILTSTYKVLLLSSAININITSYLLLPYFTGYNTWVFPSKTIPKNLDLSYKTDLDFWDCFWKVKASLIAEFHKTDLDI